MEEVMTRTLGLRIGGIIVQLDETGKNGEIRSELHYGEDAVGDDKEFADMDELYASEAAIDRLESLVLADACSGVDILSKEYREGVQTAVDAIANNV